MPPSMGHALDGSSALLDSDSDSVWGVLRRKQRRGTENDARDPRMPACGPTGVPRQSLPASGRALGEFGRRHSRARSDQAGKTPGREDPEWPPGQGRGASPLEFPGWPVDFEKFQRQCRRTHRRPERARNARPCRLVRSHGTAHRVST